MKKRFKLSVSVAILFAIGLISTAFIAKNDDDIKYQKYKGHEKSANGTKTAYTQSAHDQTAPGTCNGCHGGGSVTPAVTLTSVPAFGPGNTYTSGTVYTITYAATGYPFFGFDLEMNAGNTTTSMTAGTLAAGTNTRYTANPYSQGFPSNISHNAKIATGNAATFTWTAPMTGDTVYLFSNTVGVNGNGSDNGDKETFYNLILYPANASVSENKSAFSDFKVFPNPAKENVNISYALKSNSNVQIHVYDLSGKMISSPLNENQVAGEHTLSFSTQNLEQGTYFVSLNANGENTKYKLTVL